jgi:hypothetical protein
MPTIPSLPASGSTSWYSHYQALDTVARGVGPSRRLSDFSGASDDAKLTAFMAYANAQTYRGITCELDENRLYTFSTRQPLYNGFSIRGSARPQDQARSSMPLGQRINVRTAGGWFYLNQSQTFGCSWQGLSMDGNSSSRLIDGHASNVLWTSVFRDISMQNASGVAGSTSQKLLVTACMFDGFWNVNNVQSRAFNVGGSDFYFSPSMMLLDTPPTLMPADGYLMSFENMSNTWVSNIYCTSEGHSAFKISGGSTDEAIWIKDCVWEGRNNTENSPGALIRQTGAQTVVKDCRFAFAMADPSATGNADQGVIHVSGGKMLVDSCTYRKQSGVSESTPFIYVSGSSTRVRVRNIITNGTWSGKPVAYQTQAGLIDADDSVTVVTA